MNAPLISVVSAIFNGERYLRESLESVLSQEGVEMEAIVVDDGSTDATSAILADYATRDSRLRVLTQGNQGLTCALLRGCAEARGEFIARHDLDDVSLPERLSRQARLLESNPRLAFVSSWARVIGPNDEVLHEQRRPPEASSRLRRGEGPCGHGSVMMRRDAYDKAGGYREEFRLAQDWDLWWRLSEIGEFAVMPEFLYAYRFDESGVSANRRGEQERFGALAEAAERARRKGETETEILAEAKQLSLSAAGRDSSSPAAGAYFIGRSLALRGDPAARRYLWRCVRREPWRLKAWFSLLESAVRRPGSP